MAIKLLLADDHEIVRFGLRTVLDQSQEIEIIGEAGDGVAAVSQSIESVPDVVLMDIRMPKMDGIAATKEIKSKLQNTRVLMFTSNDNQEDMFAALAAGADGYCLKDTPGTQVMAAIQAVHSGATYLDSKIAGLVLRAAMAPGNADTSSTLKKMPAFGLTEREIEVVQALVDGLCNGDIAKRLTICPETVKTHMRHIMEKLQVSDRTQAAVKAMREGLV
jgi:two-component system NarL family response regulator